MKNIIVKKIIYIGLSVISCIVLGFFLYQPAQKASADELIVGSSVEFPPFEFKENGVYKGFDIDMLNEIGKILNKKIVIKDVAFDTLLLEAQSGTIQVIASGMTPTPERAEKVLFTKPYVGTEGSSLVCVMLAPNNITKFEELYDKEVLVCDSHTSEQYLKKYPQIHLKSLQSIGEAFLALKSSKAFAFVLAQNLLAPFFEKYGKENYNVFDLNILDPSALGISKHHPELLEPIQKALDELESNGTLQKLKTQWNVA